MKKGDKIVGVILFSLIILSGIGVLFYQYMNKDKELIALVVQKEKIINSIDLSSMKEQKEWTVESEEGHYNKILVKDGKIRFSEAECPDQVCVKTGWLSKAGDIAVCIPSQIFIKIEGQKEEVDELSY